MKHRVYRFEWDYFEIICEHGVGHPDKKENSRGHGCCVNKCCEKEGFFG